MYITLYCKAFNEELYVKRDPLLSSQLFMYFKIQRHQPCISKNISDPTLYLFQILNIRNCVLYGDIASTQICSGIERFGGFNIDSDKTKLPPSSGT